MGQFRRKLGLSPELYDHTKAVSTGNRRADVLLDSGEEKPDTSPKGEQPAPARPPQMPESSD